MIAMLDPKTLTVLVTGATAGLGAAIAGRFAETGSRVIATGRRAERNAALEKLHHGRIAALGEGEQEPVGREIAGEFVIVEQGPAQDFEPRRGILAAEFSGSLRQMRENRTGLAELARALDEHRDFAHLVDVLPIFGRARLAVDMLDAHPQQARPAQRA